MYQIVQKIDQRRERLDFTHKLAGQQTQTLLVTMLP